MNVVLQDALTRGEDILVVFAHGGEYTGRQVENVHGLQVWYYTPPGQCTTDRELKPIIAALQQGSVPAQGTQGHVRLRSDSHNIDNTSFEFHDARGIVERTVNLQFGVWRLTADGLRKEQVNLTKMTSMAQILTKARQLGIRHVVQLSCKAKSFFAQITGPCPSCPGGTGVIRLDPEASPINVLLDMQCCSCGMKMEPATLQVAGLSWSMDLSVMDAASGNVARRHEPMQKATGSIGRPQQFPLRVSPDDSICELVINLQR